MSESGAVVSNAGPLILLEPDSPLYTDLLNIAERREQGALHLHEHAEVWGE